ncbi:hypothetical protein QBC41DRAFT_384216 [Cercophora samala]|uniref:Protein kinase domain-containing protein n=1 Tax=Cercophora samala TaxID=330535 RepID=A0AA39YXV6_9PEZI|nr:hypothetical protein QBC41DRAFT_384216 [Cercophora samala]
MSLSFWSTSTGHAAEQSTEVKPSRTFTALNFLSALAVPGLSQYTSRRLGLAGSSVWRAGSGGYAVVEIGAERSGRAVAVKRSRHLLGSVPGIQDGLFVRHFEQLTLELRILGHRKLRKHANIVKILGLCIDQVNGFPDLALVLEYSELGSLQSFLQDGRGNGVPLAERLAAIRQVAQGLEALHQLKVCHGDVKLENVLVFPCEDQGFLIKISDFGQSVIAPLTLDGAPAEVEPPMGTRLLAAPEIRKGSMLRDASFTIDSAILTDVFSFGLLAWEVVRLGRRFFDLAWLDSNSGNAVSVDSMVGFLNRLSRNGLCSYALLDLQRMDIENPEDRYHLQKLLEGSLQDDPLARKPMADLVTESGEESQATFDLEDLPSRASVGSLLDLFDGSLAAWNSRNSLYEVRDNSTLFSQVTIDYLPDNLKQRVIADLKALATAEHEPASVRAHAAMTISECYTLGFGVTHDTEEVARWLLEAALNGLRKAQLWYHRVCAALGTVPSPKAGHLKGKNLEQQLATVPPELYLVRRIQLYNITTIEDARMALNLSPGVKSILAVDNHLAFRISLFNEEVTDDLPPLHLAAWLGEDAIVKDLLVRTASDTKSKLGFSAAHYACLGGSLAALRTLVDRNVPLSPATFRNITPLHLCVFMPMPDLDEAVHLLIQNGTSVDERTGSLKFDDHDIHMEGTAMSWAIESRHRLMVRLLLPHSPLQDYEWLLLATARFYWDILEELLPRFEDDTDIHDPPLLVTVKRPFAHWVAHGSDHIIAIERTVQVCIKRGLMKFEEGDTSDATDLDILISNARTWEDLHLIDAVIAASPTSYIKRQSVEYGSRPPVVAAFDVAGSNPIWYNTLRRMVELYSIEELETFQRPERGILIAAVTAESVVATRVLLEKGVDVNKPYPAVGGFEVTAIQACILFSGSAEMVSLLIEYGADLLIRDPLTGRTPLQWLVDGRLQTAKILDLLTKRDYKDSFYGNILDDALENVCIPESLLQQQSHPRKQGVYREQFRSLITHPRFARYINAPYMSGLTMIHKSALALDVWSVRLLLDAGADAGVCLHVGELRLLPLQIACTRARCLFMTDSLSLAQEEVAIIEQQKSQSMLVASELLKWHQAKKDGLFEGISLGHLVNRMLMPPKLTKLKPEDWAGKGTWPGIDEKVTPKDLIMMRLKEDEAWPEIVQAMNRPKRK